MRATPTKQEHIATQRYKLARMTVTILQQAPLRGPSVPLQLVHPMRPHVKDNQDPRYSELLFGVQSATKSLKYIKGDSPFLSLPHPLRSAAGRPEWYTLLNRQLSLGTPTASPVGEQMATLMFLPSGSSTASGQQTYIYI